MNEFEGPVWIDTTVITSMPGSSGFILRVAGPFARQSHSVQDAILFAIDPDLDELQKIA